MSEVNAVDMRVCMGVGKLSKLGTRICRFLVVGSVWRRRG